MTDHDHYRESLNWPRRRRPNPSWPASGPPLSELADTADACAQDDPGFARVVAACRAAGQQRVWISYSGEWIDPDPDAPPMEVGVAYPLAEGDDDYLSHCRDNLDEVAAKGKVVLIRKRSDYFGGDQAQDYRSEVLKNPTWLQVAVCANASVPVTRDFHHLYLNDTLYRRGREGKVAVYEISLDS
jgi:hypothetical protein